MDKPVISENFTLDDIHKIREYHYEKRKNMSTEEFITDISKNAEKGKKRIAELRKKKMAI